MHRFVWDLREAPPRALQHDLPISAVPHGTPRTPEGPLVVPGRYTVALDADGRRLERPLTVVMDPRVTISPAALVEQYRLAMRLVAIMDRSAAAGRRELNDQAAALLDIIDGADAPPTSQAAEAVRSLEGQESRIPKR
ncbi:MAG: hypothetical protein JO263_05215 [Candidatus Eremiobacteraeota bacterium]|nr:hypothetical protein [Candidatus Eremiobacteraeota bacterium]